LRPSLALLGPARLSCSVQWKTALQMHSHASWKGLRKKLNHLVLPEGQALRRLRFITSKDNPKRGRNLMLWGTESNRLGRISCQTWREQFLMWTTCPVQYLCWLQTECRISEWVMMHEQIECIIVNFLIRFLSLDRSDFETRRFCIIYGVSDSPQKLMIESICPFSLSRRDWLGIFDCNFNRSS
jgi:hypothetical protein